jgi:hypothetical protein
VSTSCDLLNRVTAVDSKKTGCSVAATDWVINSNPGEQLAAVHHTCPAKAAVCWGWLCFL